jgi:MraZ protein
MFAGSHLLTVDDKGRLAIPARFRAQLLEKYGPQVFITRSYQACVEIYPASEFRAVVEQIDQMADRRKADLATRAFIGHAEETEIDRQGRVLLPQLLRKLAHLDGDSDAVAVGQNKRIEIWSERVWTDKFTAGQDELADAFSLVKR